MQTTNLGFKKPQDSDYFDPLVFVGENMELVNQLLQVAEILARLKTVDGSGSGLDADLLDGKESTYFATATDVETRLKGVKSTTAPSDTTMIWVDTN